MEICHPDIWWFLTFIRVPHPLVRWIGIGLLGEETPRHFHSLRIRSILFYRRFLIFLGKIDNIFNIDGSSIECWKILKAQPGAKVWRQYFCSHTSLLLILLQFATFLRIFIGARGKQGTFAYIINFHLPGSWKLHQYHLLNSS